jgi:FixJ family two-component response regulator
MVTGAGSAHCQGLTMETLHMPNKPLVAIVDDDESIRETTKDLLASAGLQSAAFASAEEFLRCGLQLDFACLVADMRMAGMSGLALHEHLVAAGHPIPTILMTAYPDEPARARALGTGVMAYIAKPFTGEELLGWISAAPRRKEA